MQDHDDKHTDYSDAEWEAAIERALIRLEAEMRGDDDTTLE